MIESLILLVLLIILILFLVVFKEQDDDGENVYEGNPGVLEGNGLAHWDEFEYSGIFKQTQHKENSIVYLTL